MHSWKSWKFNSINCLRSVNELNKGEILLNFLYFKNNLSPTPLQNRTIRVHSHIYFISFKMPCKRSRLAVVGYCLVVTLSDVDSYRYIFYDILCFLCCRYFCNVLDWFDKLGSWFSGTARVGPDTTLTRFMEQRSRWFNNHSKFAIKKLHTSSALHLWFRSPWIFIFHRNKGSYL